MADAAEEDVDQNVVLIRITAVERKWRNRCRSVSSSVTFVGNMASFLE